MGRQLRGKGRRRRGGGGEGQGREKEKRRKIDKGRVCEGAPFFSKS